MQRLPQSGNEPSFLEDNLQTSSFDRLYLYRGETEALPAFPSEKKDHSRQMFWPQYESKAASSARGTDIAAWFRPGADRHSLFSASDVAWSFRHIRFHQRCNTNVNKADVC